MYENFTNTKGHLGKLIEEMIGKAVTSIDALQS